MTPRRRGAALLAAAALLLGACTTVPGTSAPDVVRSVDNGPQIETPRTCGPSGQLARSTVTTFLDLNAQANFDAARVCLTANARAQWNPASSVTIIDNETIGNVRKGTLRVTGREVGQLTNGAYKPSLAGDGSGDSGQFYPVSFGMKHVHGQWRIDTVQPNGRVVTTDQFEDFQQRYLYFFDVGETKLVPVPLYTQITDPQELARWLVAGLAAGPENNALATSLPGQQDPSQVRVTFPQLGADPSAQVEIPGASKLSGATLARLAVQLAKTLEQAGIARIAITDQGVPVHIGPGTSFTPETVLREGNNPYEAQPTQGALYYLENGALYQAVGAISRPVPGPVGAGVYALTSVAVTLPEGSPNLRIAGVRGIGPRKYLLIGGQRGPLQATRPHLSGDLSRPAWAPGSSEVWIGDGHSLDRVLARNNTVQDVPIEPQLPQKYYITAVRLSPEGARVALVVSTSPASSPSFDTRSQIWVGTVVRTGGRVRVAGLSAISPPGVHVNDVAWYDADKLFAIGSYVVTKNFATFEVQADGSLWTFHLPINLPGRPSTLTAASNSVAVVAVGTSLWRQDGASWVSLLGGEGGFAPGTDPIYIE
jgi:hypothetical protein